MVEIGLMFFAIKKNLNPADSLVCLYLYKYVYFIPLQELHVQMHISYIMKKNIKCISIRHRQNLHLLRNIKVSPETGPPIDALRPPFFADDAASRLMAVCVSCVFLLARIFCSC